MNRLARPKMPTVRRPYLSLIGAAQDDPKLARSFLDGLVTPRVNAAR
jgi:hypothetical protein